MSSRGALPTFIVIGAMKCGTTSLHSYIARHPDASMSDPKEVDFFSGENSHRPLEWYMSLFDPSRPVRGESSQDYSKAHIPLYKGAPERIKALIPDVKLIYMVRDPIERYFSHIAENHYLGSRNDQKWSEANDNYVLTGLYHHQLTFFLQHFPIDQIMVLDLHDLKTNRVATMSQVFDFVGLSPLPDEKFDFEENSTAAKPVPRFIEEMLPVRAGRRLFPKLTDKVLSHPSMRKRLAPRRVEAGIDANERARLAERFRGDADKLRALLDRDFANWTV